MTFISLVLQIAMLTGVLLLVPVIFAAFADVIADLGERRMRRSAAELPYASTDGRDPRGNASNADDSDGDRDGAGGTEDRHHAHAGRRAA